MPGEQREYNRAAGPMNTQALILTSSAELNTEDAEIPVVDRKIPAYTARPSGQKSAPILLVLSEAFGVHEHIRDICRRFAHEGYFAIAPDLMVRQGNPNEFRDVDSLVRDLLVKIPDHQVLKDLDRTIEWASRNGGNINDTFVTGFCWGGRWTWLLAAHRRLRAAVAWYGILDGRRSDIFRKVLDRYPVHPIDLAKQLQTPVLGLYGGQDAAIPLSTIEAMQQALAVGDAASRVSVIHVYPEAGHAFFADYRESYVQSAAVNGWERCLRWLAQPPTVNPS